MGERLTTRAVPFGGAAGGTIADRLTILARVSDATEKPGPRRWPDTPVFESEFEGHRVEVFADHNGIRVEVPAGTLYLTDWASWILHSCLQWPTSADQTERWALWTAAARAIPPGNPE